MKKTPEKNRNRCYKSTFLVLFALSLVFLAFSPLFAFTQYFNNPRFLSLVSLWRHDSNVPIRPSNPNFFYGVNVEMSQILPTSPRYIMNNRGEDLIDIAARLGINLFRITNATSGLKGNGDAIYTKKQWDMVLGKMERKGIKALIVVEAESKDVNLYTDTISPDYLKLVKRYIIDSSVLSSEDVYAVDLKNEPIINLGNNVSLIRTAAKMVKSAYPHARLTVGWWGIDTFKKDGDGNEIYNWDTYNAGKALNNFIDFYSIHIYGFDRKTLNLYPDPYVYTQNFISQVKQGLQTTKPILVEEFGAANGEAVSDQDAVGSPELQANVYAGVYQAVNAMKDAQITGVVSYQFYARTSTPDAWAIVKDDGNYLFPAAYVVQKYATGMASIPLSLPLSPVPHDYLLHNEDNNKLFHMHVHDIIGFELTFDPAHSYSISAHGDSVLLASQALTFVSQYNKYYAVYHAVRSGQVRLVIKQAQTCQSSAPCTGNSTDIFLVNIAVR